MFYVGLDIHQKTSSVCILDRNGKRVKQETLKGHWKNMIQWLARYSGYGTAKPKPITVCYEASCGYGEIHDRLAKIAKRVEVAHPGAVRMIFRATRKNDRIDAQKLAKLLYLDEVPQVHVPRVQMRSWRRMIEFRRKTVDSQTRVKNQVRALMRSHGVVQPRGIGGLWTKAGMKWLAEFSWPTEEARIECWMLLEELKGVWERVRLLTNKLNHIQRKHPAVALLKSIPGVGPRTAEAMVAYVDDPHRFARSKQIGAYLGMIPCQDSSASVNRLGHITKEGPGTLRKLLIEASWQSIRRDAHMKEYFERIKAGKPERKKIALVATAHHLARCMLAMLKHGETWNPNQHDHQEESESQATAAWAAAA